MSDKIFFKNNETAIAFAFSRSRNLQAYCKMTIQYWLSKYKLLSICYTDLVESCPCPLGNLNYSLHAILKE